jgi:hypothetical protein
MMRTMCTLLPTGLLALTGLVPGFAAVEAPVLVRSATATVLAAAIHLPPQLATCSASAATAWSGGSLPLLLLANAGLPFLLREE